MKTIALSVSGNRISPRLDCAGKLLLVHANDSKIKTKEHLNLSCEDPLNNINVLTQLKPDVLICGGLTELYSNKLKNSKIKVIPWVQGDIEKILSLYMDGRL